MYAQRDKKSAILIFRNVFNFEFLKFSFYFIIPSHVHFMKLLHLEFKNLQIGFVERFRLEFCNEPDSLLTIETRNCVICSFIK